MTNAIPAAQADNF